MRLLAGLDLVQVEEPAQTVAERLGLWMDWTDAISLSAVLNTGAAAPAGTALAGPDAAVATRAAAALAQVRKTLAEAIAQDVAFAPTAAPPLPAGAPGDAEHAAYRSAYFAHQRAMETRIAPLRAGLRAALAAGGPDLARLAALDAVLEKALAARERQLLATLPSWLEKHGRRLRLAQPTTWRAPYGRELQAALQAELETRLQPVEGMLEALNHSTRKTAPAAPQAAALTQP